MPVVPAHFRSPQRGMALVAAAGPLTNLAVAAVFAAILLHVTLTGTWFDVALLALLVNVTLFLFNLLPIPPLDGSRIVGALMDDAAYDRWLSFDRYGVAVVLALVLVFNSQFQAILSGWYRRGAERVPDRARLSRRLRCPRFEPELGRGRGSAAAALGRRGRRRGRLLRAARRRLRRARTRVSTLG